MLKKDTSFQHIIVQRGNIVILHSHSEIQPNSSYWFSTYWFRASYPFRPLTDSALTGSALAKQPLKFNRNLNFCLLMEK
ncbi:hypothetical protein Hanom_Chr00s000001g01593831 [Helianthus anomalus]